MIPRKALENGIVEGEKLITDGKYYSVF